MTAARPTASIAAPDTGTWATIARLAAWLDQEAGTSPETTRLERIMKITEEVGEVAEAVEAAFSPDRNPVQGLEHIKAELCDVVLTAMVALKTINPQADEMPSGDLAAHDVATEPAVSELVCLRGVRRLSKDAGTIAKAVHGARGSNPRKGHSHTWDDVEAGLRRLITTAATTLHTITPDAEKVFAEHLNFITARSLTT